MQKQPDLSVVFSLIDRSGPGLLTARHILSECLLECWEDKNRRGKHMKKKKRRSCRGPHKGTNEARVIDVRHRRTDASQIRATLIKSRLHLKETLRDCL